MQLVGIFISAAIILGIMWFSALLVGAKNRSVGACVMSFAANGLLTYGMKYVTTDMFLSILLATPIIGFLNARIFDTTFIKGILISFIFGAILAAIVTYNAG